MAMIPLTKGRFALVDNEDSHWLGQWRWFYVSTRTGYAGRAEYEDGKHKMVLMHRVIMDAPPGMQVDHINGDTLDNRRSNLRLATQQQNRWNSAKCSGCSSQYKGVCYDKRMQRWVATIRQTWLGRFATEEEAARAYDEAARALYGEFARTNF